MMELDDTILNRRLLVEAIAKRKDLSQGQVMLVRFWNANADNGRQSWPAHWV